MLRSSDVRWFFCERPGYDESAGGGGGWGGIRTATDQVAVGSYIYT